MGEVSFGALVVSIALFGCCIASFRSLRYVAAEHGRILPARSLKLALRMMRSCVTALSWFPPVLAVIGSVEMRLALPS